MNMALQYFQIAASQWSHIIQNTNK